MARVAEGVRAAGDGATAALLVDMALETSEATNQPWWDASLHRMRAEILFDRADGRRRGRNRRHWSSPARGGGRVAARDGTGRRAWPPSARPPRRRGLRQVSRAAGSLRRGGVAAPRAAAALPGGRGHPGNPDGGRRARPTSSSRRPATDHAGRRRGPETGVAPLPSTTSAASSWPEERFYDRLRQNTWATELDPVCLLHSEGSSRPLADVRRSHLGC